MLRSAGIYFSTRVLAAALALLSVSVFTRLVPPDVYGVYTLVMSTAIAIFAIAYQWLRASVLRFVPGNNGTPKATLQAALAGYLLVSLLLMIVAGLATLAGLFPVAGPVIGLGLAVTLAYAAMEIVLASWQARKRPRIYAILTLSRAAGTLLLGAVLTVSGFGAEGLLAGILIANVAPIAAVRLFAGTHLPELRFDRSRLRKIAAFGLPLGLVGIGGTIIALSDRYLLAHLIGFDAAGAYSAPYDLAQRSLSVLMLSAFLAYSPHVFGSYGEGKLGECREAISSQLTLSLAFALPMAMVMAGAAPLIASILFGEEFRASATEVLPWIALSSLLQGIQSYHVSYGFTLPKRAGINASIVAGGALLNLPLNFLLIPPLGIVGAAIATIVSYATVLAISLLVTRRWIALPWPLRDMTKIALACIAGLPFVILADRSPSIPTGLLWLIAAGAVVAGIYLATDMFGMRKMVLRKLAGRRRGGGGE
ncbi:MAG: oligosaccharide flippase family protein [Geminicoccaceae bacterium]